MLYLSTDKLTFIFEELMVSDLHIISHIIIRETVTIRMLAQIMRESYLLKLLLNIKHQK